MNPNSIHRSDPNLIAVRGKRGFALVVTLSLMILLTVIAVGLLTLSSISLRATSGGLAQQQAQSNARMALMLAIGQLQREMGPDSRISAPDGTEIPTGGKPRLARCLRQDPRQGMV